VCSYLALGVSAERAYVDHGFTDDERVAAAEWCVRFAQTEALGVRPG
jgi:hypothetical protein